MSRGGDLGMMIIMLCGFAAYMTHIGASDVVVKLASKPLKFINSPYLLMIAACFVACLMSLAVSSVVSGKRYGMVSAEEKGHTVWQALPRPF